jgi:hypothetical protein
MLCADHNGAHIDPLDPEKAGMMKYINKLEVE